MFGGFIYTFVFWFSCRWCILRFFERFRRIAVLGFCCFFRVGRGGSDRRWVLGCWVLDKKVWVCLKKVFMFLA